MCPKATTKLFFFLLINCRLEMQAKGNWQMDCRAAFQCVRMSPLISSRSQRLRCRFNEINDSSGSPSHTSIKLTVNKRAVAHSDAKVLILASKLKCRFVCVKIASFVCFLKKIHYFNQKMLCWTKDINPEFLGKNKKSSFDHLWPVMSADFQLITCYRATVHYGVS